MNTTLTFPFFSYSESNEKIGAEKALVKLKIATVKKAIFILFFFSFKFRSGVSANP
jgi:hypothetical protein